MLLWLAKDGARREPMPLREAQALVAQGVYQPALQASIVGTDSWTAI